MNFERENDSYYKGLEYFSSIVILSRCQALIGGNTGGSCAAMFMNNMKYEYTLDCYNENGKKRELKFKTSRELKEDAFLKLEVKTFGVHSWEEVQYNELPEKVQTNYTK